MSGIKIMSIVVEGGMYLSSLAMLDMLHVSVHSVMGSTEAASGERRLLGNGIGCWCLVA